MNINSIEKINLDVYNEALKKWDSIAKPIDGMGRFETITAKIAAIQGSLDIKFDKKALIIMCADNGIVKEGISQSEQDVTLAVAKNMANKKSSACIMAKHAGIDIYPVDIGINSKEKIEGVIDKKIACGTKNFLEEPAMSKEEVSKAIETGIFLVQELKLKGYNIIATGEMGIGNTTTSSTLAAVLLKQSVENVTGKGAGLSDDKYSHKIEVIKKAIAKYDTDNMEAVELLRTFGGFDIAGLTGVFVGGALHHIPIVADGVISLIAALLAEKIAPGTKDYIIASHKGKEPAMAIILKELQLEAVIDANMALGEGTGAVMMINLLSMALGIYKNFNTFEEIKIEQYERYK
ncbi:MAG: nicotinate-nucleotide--dimethylbenzimidazole phosphoribosyltransferase [Lachnospiraceae bacterium]|nr:nicotinate-nucleotide--dimethylbenzimidazole phosphoribosyltransferase [Lachnospiraceae bacterium]